MIHGVIKMAMKIMKKAGERDDRSRHPHLANRVHLSSKEATRKGGVFDRLTDSSHFTGASKSPKMRPKRERKSNRASPTTKVSVNDTTSVGGRPEFAV